jgi:hypothetical protein
VVILCEMHDGIQPHACERVERSSIEAGHKSERFQSRRHIRNRVRMDCAAPTFVSGVERSQQFHHFDTSNLSDNQAVGAHAQRLSHQIP